MGRMTVISGAERRRRWSDEDRARILAATFEPGAVIAEVARREDFCTVSGTRAPRASFLKMSGRIGILID